jgi:hypothetical protein
VTALVFRTKYKIRFFTPLGFAGRKKKLQKERFPHITSAAPQLPALFWGEERKEGWT